MSEFNVGDPSLKECGPCISLYRPSNFKEVEMILICELWARHGQVML